jgi:hypothetical protein
VGQDNVFTRERNAHRDDIKPLREKIHMAIFVTATAAPEPDAWALVGMGFGMVAWGLLRLRRRTRA